MIRPMFGHRPKPKKFDLPLRYYDPEKDEKEKRKERIRFESKTRRHDRQGTKVLLYAALLFLVVWIISLL